MKKTATAMLTLVAGIVAASCQKEAEPDIKSFEPMTINAVSEGIGTATKTEMAYKYDILWSEDDQIYVTDGTSNDTFTLSAGEGTTKGTFTQDGEVTFNDEVQAYYPATMVQDGGLVWPATQTNNQTVPMYSTKTVSGNVEDFNFASLGSVLQIVFTTPQSDVKLQSIEIQDGTKTMSGSFTIDEDGKAIITATDKAGITLDLGEGVAVGLAAKYFNIAVPAGNYHNLTLVFTATDGTKCTMTGGTLNIAYNTVGRLTLTGEKFKADVPEGALAGKFSVSATKKVHFSKGNLYWDGSAFRFEAHQYVFQSSWSTSHVSHFHWSKDADEAVKQDFNWAQSMSAGDVFFTNVDGFKVNVGGKDQTGWRTLSTNEWQYLFNTRTVNGGQGAGKSYSFNITYGGKMGLVLYPDDYSGSTLTSGTDYTDANFPADCVFLPAAGSRDGSDVDGVGVGGRYWSSAAFDVSYAYDVGFGSSSVTPDFLGRRHYGYSVRLITESN